MAEGTTLIPTNVCWILEGNISSSDPVWFGQERQIPAGWYRIRYTRGAFRSSAYAWIVSPGWTLCSRLGQVVDLVAAPGSSIPSASSSLPKGSIAASGYDTQEAAENASGTPFRDFYHTGGPIGLYLSNSYAAANNTNGSPNPTFKLCALTDKITCTGAEAATITGAMELTSSPSSVKNGKLESDTVIHLIPERCNFALQQDVYVDFSKTGNYTKSSEIARVLVPKSTVVTSYLVHFDPAKVIGTGLTASVKFSRKILGIMASKELISSTNIMLGTIGTTDYYDSNDTDSTDGIEFATLSDGSPANRIIIGTDLQTLTVSLYSFGSSDSLRVLLAADSAEETTECEKETKQTGLLSSKYKILLDQVTSYPGGFGFVFKPGFFLNGSDNVLSGQVAITSNSLDLAAVAVNDSTGQKTQITIAPGQVFLDSFCAQIDTLKGDKGPTGAKGPQGFMGTGDGPAGAQGDAGADAPEPTFAGVEVVESDTTYSSAVTGLSLNTQDLVLSVTKGNLAVPTNDTPAKKVVATRVYRSVTFGGSLSQWSLSAPVGDTVPINLDAIILPSGWSGQSTDPVPITTVKLSELVAWLTNYYQAKVDTITAEWQQAADEYIRAKDESARTILAELAQELTESVWSEPINMTVELQAVPCVEDTTK